jgi:small subunit ribosomal protein S21
MSNHIKGMGIGNKRGLFVEVKGNNINQALKILKRKVAQEGILKELKKREYYERPGIRRRRKRAEAIRRHEKALYLAANPQKEKPARDQQQQSMPGIV